MNSPPRRHSIPIALALSAGIFLIDTLSSLHFAVASLYVLVILLGARDFRRSGIIMTGLLCGTLTTVSYLITHGFTLAGAAPLRSAVSFVSIAVTVILVLQGISTWRTLRCTSAGTHKSGALLLAGNSGTACWHRCTALSGAAAKSGDPLRGHRWLYRPYFGKTSRIRLRPTPGFARNDERCRFFVSGLNRQVSRRWAYGCIWTPPDKPAGRNQRGRLRAGNHQASCRLEQDECAAQSNAGCYRYSLRRGHSR